MMSSLSSLASDSTISTASEVPATTRSSWVSTISSSVGLSTYSSLTKPTRAAPIGPLQGATDSVSAGDAARGVGLFLIVDGQRQEVDAFPWGLGGDDGGEHDGFAIGGQHGAVGL